MCSQTALQWLLKRETENNTDIQAVAPDLILKENLQEQEKFLLMQHKEQEFSKSSQMNKSKDRYQTRPQNQPSLGVI